MALKLLYKSKAYEPGSELWICSGDANCSFTKELNWYSNFMLSRSLTHKMPPLSGRLHKTIIELELDMLIPKDKKLNNCLIETSEHFPNRYLLVRPMKKDLSTWIQDCLQIWDGLQKPSVRFFVPPKHNTEDFEKALPKSNYLMDISLVSH